MSKTLFILNGPPYGTEGSYNGLRLAGALVKREGQDVRVFLMGDAAACAKKNQKVPAGYYNIEVMLNNVSRGGGQIRVCGTCMEARGIAEDDLLQGSSKSTLGELADWTAEADKVLVF